MCMCARVCICVRVFVCIEGVTGKQKGLETQKMKERKKQAHVCVSVWEGEKMKLEEAGMRVSTCLCVIAEKALLGERKGRRDRKQETRKKRGMCVSLGK